MDQKQLLDETPTTHINDLLKIVEITTDVVMICSSDENIIFVNPAFEKLTGYNKEDVIGKTPRILKSGMHNVDFYNKMWNILRNGEAYTDTFCNRKKNGDLYWIETTIVPTLNATGEIHHIISSGRELTKKKASKSYDTNNFEEQPEYYTPLDFQIDTEDVKLLEEKLRLLYSATVQSPVSIVITDTNGDITYVNPKFEEISGYTKKEVLGKNPRVLKSDYKTADEYEELWKMITSGQQWSGEFQNRSKDGRLYWERATIGPICNEKGIVTHFMAIKEDISEEKEMREQLSLEHENAINSQIRLLSSQINPHFMFNALNSVQYYILEADHESALIFVSEFSSLMRAVLNYSMRTFIPLKEEVSFITNFLNLEKMRLNNKFKCEIVVDESIDIETVYIPPMLIQPYVENTIIHGLGGSIVNGKLTIHYSRNADNFIKCSIDDNGIGRKKAIEFNATQNKYKGKSYGMSITHKRLDLLNTIVPDNLTVTVIDKTDENNNACGTRVEITFPDYLSEMRL